MKTPRLPLLDVVIVSCFRPTNVPDIVNALSKCVFVRKIHVLHQLPSRTHVEKAENIYLDANYGPGIRHFYAGENIRDVEFVWFQDDDWRIDESSDNIKSILNAIQEFGQTSSAIGPVVKGYDYNGGRFSRIDKGLAFTALQSPPYFVLGRLHIVKLTSLIRCVPILRGIHRKYASLYWRSDDIVLSFVLSTIEEQTVREISCKMIEMQACDALSDEPEHRDQRAELARTLIAMIVDKQLEQCV